jgi:RNA polymerase sigma-70 factor (ECF subfamily)
MQPPSPVNGVADLADAVRRAQTGDVGAFELLYRANAPTIYRLCRRMVGDDTAARELLQDVFVRAWERLPTFQGQSALGTWLHRLAVNVVLNHLRGARRDALRLTDESADIATRPIAGQIDARIDLDDAIARLPTGARTVFLLHDVEGYTHEEIAEQTGIAPGTARAHLCHARRALMKLLDR